LFHRSSFRILYLILFSRRKDRGARDPPSSLLPGQLAADIRDLFSQTAQAQFELLVRTDNRLLGSDNLFSRPALAGKRSAQLK